MTAPVIFRDTQGRVCEANFHLFVIPLGFDLVISLSDVKAHFAVCSLVDVMILSIGNN